MLIVLIAKPTLAPLPVREFFQPKVVAAERAATEKQARERAEAEAKSAAAQAAATRAKLWSALDPSDLPTLVQRLRTAGFSAKLIRAIVSARIDAQFSPRLRELDAEANQRPYWKTDPTDFFGSKFWMAREQIYRERGKIMREILKDPFFQNDSDITAEQRHRFGNLSSTKIALVEQITADYGDIRSQIEIAMRNITLPEDREKLAYLEKEMHADLGTVLTPQELDDFEMRRSKVTNRLRSAMTIMNASENEFRSLYQIIQPYAETVFPSGGNSGDQADQRREAWNQIDAAVKSTLGEQRYADFVRATDSQYQQLTRMAQRSNVSLDAVNHAYDLREAAAVESNRIYEDTTLTIDQKREALKTLAATTRTQLVSALGSTVGSAYVSSAGWLNAIERGSAVTFNPHNQTNYKNLPRNPPPRKGQG